MKFKRLARILYLFYTTYLWLSVLITLSCGAAYYFIGYKVLGNLLFIRIVFDALIWYFINAYKKKEFYYYRNLGITKTMLWGATLIFDFGFFVLTLLTISYIR